MSYGSGQTPGSSHMIVGQSNMAREFSALKLLVRKGHGIWWHHWPNIVTWHCPNMTIWLYEVNIVSSITNSLLHVALGQGILWLQLIGPLACYHVIVGFSPNLISSPVQAHIGSLWNYTKPTTGPKNRTLHPKTGTPQTPRWTGTELGTMGGRSHYYGVED